MQEIIKLLVQGGPILVTVITLTDIESHNMDKNCMIIPEIQQSVA